MKARNENLTSIDAIMDGGIRGNAGKHLNV